MVAPRHPGSRAVSGRLVAMASVVCSVPPRGKPRIGKEGGHGRRQPSRDTNGRDSVSSEGDFRRPLRAAVIGAGKIAAEHFRFFESNPDANLAAVCDLSPALAKWSAATFKAERSYTDHARMLAEVQPDVVHVCTPPSTHRPIVIDCLDAGAHVFCEKPIAPTNGEFRELWEMALGKGRVLVEDQTYRFTRNFLMLQEMVKEGRIGEVRDVEIRVILDVAGPASRYGDANLPHPSHDLPAGVIHEFLPHMTYLALQFLPEVGSMRAAWNRYCGNELFRADDLDALVIGGGVHARLRFSAGHWPDCFLITVRGSGGWIETELFRPYLRLTTPRVGGDKLGHFVNHVHNGMEFLRASVCGFWDKVMQRDAYDGIDTLLARTYGALLEGNEPPVTYDDMDRSTRLVDNLVKEENRV
jgi:predicted dehydrogenase